jgi:hypothetical protein
MNIIILIIASDNTDNYIEMQKIWRKYMNKCNPNIRSFFIKNEPTLNEDIIAINDTIYIKENENYIPGILSKTIKSIQYCLNNFDFDYIYRTNLSSFLNLYKINDFINNNTLNYGGVIGDFKGIKYASGSGFFLSKDTCIYLCKNNNLLDYNLIDDVSIGNFLNKTYNIFFIDRCNINCLENDKFIINNNIFHYRCKCEENHSITVSIMNKLFNMIYL